MPNEPKILSKSERDKAKVYRFQVLSHHSGVSAGTIIGAYVRALATCEAMAESIEALLEIADEWRAEKIAALGQKRYDDKCELYEEQIVKARELIR